MTLQQLQEERVADLAELEHSVGIIDEDGYPTQALLDYISQAITQTAEAAQARCIKEMQVMRKALAERKDKLDQGTLAICLAYIQACEEDIRANSLSKP
jgi:hypothetical protein